MRIAFVGKGGAGKTTMSALLTQCIAKTKPVVAIDADINMHMAELLGLESPDRSHLISEKQPSTLIREHLRANNSKVPSNAYMKKTTPPSIGSGLINMADSHDWFMEQFATQTADNISLITVGSYSEDGIASSCYHNNLSVLENVLTHTVDGANIVTDMVAGTDAFASTLFSQFDALVFVAEPTKRSVSVYKQYASLADAAGVIDRLYCIGNKIDDETDEAFLREHIGKNYYGGVSRLKHVAMVDKGREGLSIDKISTDDRAVLTNLVKEIEKNTITMQDRLEGLWKLHKNYVSQAFVKDRFGDLTIQIDKDFRYPVLEAIQQ